MSKVVLFGMLLILYLGYVAFGMHLRFEIGWVDWNDPFLHYRITSWTNVNPFILPVLALLWSLNVWYKLYVIGEN